MMIGFIVSAWFSVGFAMCLVDGMDPSCTSPRWRQYIFWPLYFVGWFVRSLIIAIREACTGEEAE